MQPGSNGAFTRPYFGRKAADERLLAVVAVYATRLLIKFNYLVLAIENLEELYDPLQ